MESRIILALDEMELTDGIFLTTRVGSALYAAKIHDLLDKHGPGVIKNLLDAGAKRIWVDLKLHDISNTVKARAKALAEAGANMITVHASGGIKMMKAALEGVKGTSTEIYAVTVLTSLGENEVRVNYRQSTEKAVLSLAHVARLAGVHGIVCSAREVAMLRKLPKFREMKFITPGVRSEGIPSDDQVRIATPAEAIKAGATYIVVGRQVTLAEDPETELRRIEREVEEALHPTS